MKRLQVAIGCIQAELGCVLDIRVYRPAPSNLEVTALRYLAWDLYGKTPDQALNRYGSKQYYLCSSPLSLALAQQRLLMDIALFLKQHFMNDLSYHDSRFKFQAMVQGITLFMTEYIANAVHSAMS